MVLGLSLQKMGIYRSGLHEQRYCPMKLTDGERLVKLETQVSAVLNGIEDIKRENKEFRDKLEPLLPTYATKEEIESLKKKNTLQVWLTGTLSAGFGSILTFLIIYFISNIGK